MAEYLLNLKAAFELLCVRSSSEPEPFFTFAIATFAIVSFLVVVAATGWIKLRPTYLVVVAIFLLVGIGRLEMNYAFLGFRGITEYDAAVVRAVNIFGLFSLAVLVWLIALGIWSRKTDITRAFLVTAAIYALAIVTVLLLHLHYAATLPGPWGG